MVDCKWMQDEICVHGDCPMCAGLRKGVNDMWLIDTDTLMDELYEKILDEEVLNRIIPIVDAAPAADAIPMVHGRWGERQMYGL